ncbi:hypothetical protein C4544_04040 [candidate division WS5 bacterium]|uniref:Uncharacterized protein n=1 Tax=candidate division WS5 bacterium TaxID=2093353 RepID=A0A419DCX3_9BACT|nr:MAG: hypothetical protein C4544_04040 [candidate division WS5 bacterium]
MNWVRNISDTTLDMIFRHYGKFIRNRMRRDGARFLKGFEEAGMVTTVPAGDVIVEPANPLPARIGGPTKILHGESAKDFGHNLVTNPI